MKTTEEKVLYRRQVVDVTELEADPDDLVLEAARKEAGEGVKVTSENFVIHSTSWRHEGEAVLLTYVVYSEAFIYPNNGSSMLDFADLEIATGESSIHPRPRVIDEKHVVSHALRHLGFLVKNDTEGKYAMAIDEESTERLKKIFGDLAGEI